MERRSVAEYALQVVAQRGTGIRARPVPGSITATATAVRDLGPEAALAGGPGPNLTLAARGQFERPVAEAHALTLDRVAGLEIPGATG